MKHPLKGPISLAELVEWMNDQGYCSDGEYDKELEELSAKETIYWPGDVDSRPIIDALIEKGIGEADNVLEDLLRRSLTRAYIEGHMHAVQALGGIVTGSNEPDATSQQGGK